MQIVKVNRLKDFLDRVIWTFLGVFVSLVSLDWFSNGINLNVGHKLEEALAAAAFTTVKVLIAQRTGQHPLGDAVPGGVLETERSTK